MTIEHLALSGGGPALISSLGAIIEAEEREIFNPAQIKSIYASSGGAVVALFFCLHRDKHFEWETITEFFIHRPWEEVFNLNPTIIIESYHSRGIFGTDTLKKCFHSFFDARDISLDITLKEFHDTVSPIDLHFFAFELNAFKLVDISWITHPEVGFFQALHMTCSLPLIFAPVLIEGDAPFCYIDGGVVCNYPIKYCLHAVGNDANTILGFKNIYDDTSTNRNVTSQSTLLDYLISFVYKFINALREKDEPPVPNEIKCQADFMSLDYIKRAIHSAETRAALIESGRQAVRDWRPPT